MSRSHQQQHHHHHHDTRGNREYINPAGPASKPRTIPELNGVLRQHGLSPIRILTACDDEIGIWSLRDYFRYLGRNLSWEGNWSNVRQRVEEELVRARTGRFKYDFDDNGEFRYPRGMRGSGGDYPATLPGNRVSHYQYPWQRQDPSGGQGSRHGTNPGQGSHHAQNFHNHPGPFPNSSGHSGSHGRSGGRASSRAIPTGRSGHAGEGSGTQRRSNGGQERYDLPYR